MSCHPTDPDNLVPEGAREVPVDTVTRECAGMLVLIQRELRIFDSLARILPSDQDLLREYRLRRPLGLTVDGLAENVHRVLFNEAAKDGRLGMLYMTIQDLNAEIGHDPLPWPFDVRLAF
jgi:hypothetical protein